MNQELDLLDKVELRFGLAQNETDFEAQVMGLLVPVLLKLDSPHQAVRDKVGSNFFIADTFPIFIDQIKLMTV